MNIPKSTKKVEKNINKSFSTSVFSKFSVYYSSPVRSGSSISASYSAFSPCCSISKLAQINGPTPLGSLSRIGSLM